MDFRDLILDSFENRHLPFGKYVVSFYKLREANKRNSVSIWAPQRCHGNLSVNCLGKFIRTVIEKDHWLHNEATKIHVNILLRKESRKKNTLSSPTKSYTNR